jgi:pimeloyl-ACP methyl ester carboxylesterase
METTSVTSRDGTRIGYRRLGTGPGLVLLHGAMSSGHNHVQLAEALADAFTLYLPDRRGRGLSGPHRPDHGLRTEVEDLDALLAATGARYVFGVSAGAAIALRAALAGSTVDRIAIFEPPLFVDRPVPVALLRRFDRELAAGDTAGALVTAMKATHMGPAVFNVVPRWLLRRLTGMAMAQEERRPANGYIPMRALAPTLRHDFGTAVELDGTLDSLRDVRVRALLLGGSKSPAFLKAGLAALEKILPDAERVELPGVGHDASWNSDRRGRPDVVARELRRFFAAR